MCFIVAVCSCLTWLLGHFQTTKLCTFHAWFCAGKPRKISTSSRNESSLQKDLEEGSNLVDILHMHIDPLLLHPLERCCESLGQGGVVIALLKWTIDSSFLVRVGKLSRSNSTCPGARSINYELFIIYSTSSWLSAATTTTDTTAQQPTDTIARTAPAQHNTSSRWLMLL